MLILPLSAAFIGYGTNLVAIAMLLRPYKPKYLMGIRLPFTPGLVHKRRNQIATILAATINDTLLTKDTLEKAVPKAFIEQEIGRFLAQKYTALKATEKDAKTYLEHILGEQIATALLGYLQNETMISGNISAIVTVLKELIENEDINVKFKELVKGVIEQSFGKMPAMMFHQKVYESIKDKASEYLSDEPKLTEQILGFIQDKKDDVVQTHLKNMLSKIEDSQFDEFSAFVSMQVTMYLQQRIDKYVTQLDFKKGIEEKILELPEAEIEALILRVAKKELKYIALLGGVLGLVIGLAIELVKVML